MYTFELIPCAILINSHERKNYKVEEPVFDFIIFYSKFLKFLYIFSRKVLIYGGFKS